jgi:cbb3-type cytochrome oxidase subunit 3
MKVIGSLVGIVAGVLYIDSNLILAIIMIFLNLVLFVYEAANKK